MITSLKVQFKLGKDNYSISLVNGVPTYWALFVAQSTGAALATTGDPNQIYYMPILGQYT